jgi:hypothetical protein
MDVEASQRRRLQHSRRKDLAVCCNDDDVRGCVPDHAKRFRITQAVRLDERKPFCGGISFHRGISRLMASALWPVRLRQHEGQRKTRLIQPVKGFHRQLRRPHKYYAQILTLLWLCVSVFWLRISVFWLEIGFFRLCISVFWLQIGVFCLRFAIFSPTCGVVECDRPVFEQYPVQMVGFVQDDAG